MLNYQRFFDFAPIGAFQISSAGGLLMINESFATSLNYDSVGDVFTEKANFLDFITNPQEGLELLRLLREIPGMRHEVLMQLKGGGVKAFWVISIAGATQEERSNFSCFLMDRSTDMLLDHCHREYADVIDKHGSMSIFLASTVRLFQRYLMGERRLGQSRGTAGDRRGQNNIEGAELRKNLLAPLIGEEAAQAERRQSAVLLKTVFDDIYQIAIDEAELESINIAPVNMHLLLEQLYSQAFPEMSRRRIELHTFIEATTKQRFSCSAPLLRHAFLRSLMVVTQGVYGGTAHVQLSRVDAGGQDEDIFILRSIISWEKDTDQAGLLDGNEEYLSQPGGSGSDQLLRDTSSMKKVEQAAFSRADELKVIGFLAEKSGGSLLPGVHTDESRSLQIDLFFQQVDELTVRLCVQGQYHAAFAEQAYEENPVAHGELPETFEPEPGGDVAASVDVIDLISADDLVDEDFVDSGDSAGRSLDILIVEDSLNSRLLFSRFLRGTQHRITEAENGLAGVELVRKKAFDVIFMDMEMPILDGYQATRIIRALEADEHREATPIIAQTAHVLPEYMQKCLDVGCSEVLSKPFSRNALLGILNSLAQAGLSS